jgi:FAD synthase
MEMRRLEVHLLDIPDNDYYNQQLVVKLLIFHRSNKAFASTKDLLEAIVKDEKAARNWFDTKSDL